MNEKDVIYLVGFFTIGFFKYIAAPILIVLISGTLATKKKGKKKLTILQSLISNAKF